MTKTQVEVITSEQRRRHWSPAEKERVVAAALEPVATILGVAREFGIHPGQVLRWRQQLSDKSEPGTGGDRGRTWDRARIRIIGAVDAATVTAVIAALEVGPR